MRLLLLMSALSSALGDLSKLAPPEAGRTRVYLIRHGQTDWNAAKKIQGSVDRELTAFGRRQAAAIGDALRGIPLTLVASSPLKRAAATADAIHATQPDAERISHAGLREMDFGDLEGTVPGDAYYATNDAWASGDLLRTWPGGEGPTQVDARARAALRDLGLIGQPPAAPPRHVHAAVVCHGRFNKIALASLLGRGVGSCGEIVQGNCCVNVFDIRVDAPVGATDAAAEVATNYQDHLRALREDESSTPAA